MMNTIRRLLKHHTEVFTQFSIRTLVLRILKWADSLRSALSKNALIVLGEISLYIPRQIQTELEHIINCILRKCADTNVFISDQAEKALVAVCQQCSENRIVSLVIQCVNGTRSSQVKAKCALCFLKLFQRKGADSRKFREFDKILQILSSFAKQASSQVRSNAKSALNFLATIIPQDFDRLLRRALPSVQYTSLIQALKRGQGDSPVRKVLKQFEVPIKPQKGSSDPIDFIRTQLQSQDWITRVQAVSKLKDLGMKSKTLTSKGLNCLAAGLNDQDSRVAMHTLTVLSKLLPCTPQKADLSGILPSLVILLNSMNTLLRNNAKDVCRILVHQADLAQFLPSLLASLQRPKDKAWLFLFTLLIDSLDYFYQTSSTLVYRHVVPYALSLAQKPVAGTARKFFDKLHSILGTELPPLMGEFWSNCHQLEFFNQTLKSLKIRCGLI